MMRFSFRQQIALLGATVLLSLAAMVVVVASTIRHTETALVAQGKSRAADASGALAREYAERAEQAPVLRDQLGSGSDDALKRLSDIVLARQRGVEGGFYVAATGDLPGYAFPTHDGPRPKRDVPPAERPVILDVAREAASSGHDVARTITGRADVILFHATPIRAGNVTVGSAWTMTRIPNPGAQDRERTSYVGLLLTAVTLACVLLAFLIARNLQRGVGRIEHGLEALTRDLGARLPTDGEHAELARIGAAVNRLAGALQANRERERQTEDKLRHAERLAALGRVAAGVAHEVRNPLATMRLRAQMIRGSLTRSGSEPDDAEHIVRSTGIIVEEIDRLNGLVERLLTLARPASLVRAPILLAALVERRLDAYRDRAAQLAVRIELSIVDAPVMVSADPAALAQVLDNVMQNALEAMEVRGGALIVRVGARADAAATARIEVTDTGHGIPRDVLARVVEPFFTTRARGTGLGLSITYELVRAHGGDLEIHSAIGQGTTVIIELPADGALASSPGLETEPARDAAAERSFDAALWPREVSA